MYLKYIGYTIFLFFSYLLIMPYTNAEVIKKDTSRLVLTDNIEPISAHDVLSLPILITTAVAIPAGFLTLIIVERRKEKKTVKKLYLLLLHALNQTIEDLTTRKKIMESIKLWIIKEMNWNLLKYIWILIL